MKKLMCLLALAVAAEGGAAPLRIINGNVQSASTLRAQNGSVAYSIATREPLNVSCCDGWNQDRCETCSLGRDGGLSINRREKDDIGTAAQSQLLVFARFENGAVERVRVFSPSCEIDAAGNTVQWVDNVANDASINFLRDTVEHGAGKSRNGALLALSLHAGATDTLIDLARRSRDRDVRGKALFWLSQLAGRKAADALRDAVENDPEDSVRAKAVFGISQLPDDESIPMLVDLMKHHRSREVRKKAAFWLGQKNDPRALQAIEEILTR